MKLSSAMFRHLGGAFCALVLAMPAVAVEVEGIKFDDSVKVAGKDLTLNGAGVRVRAVFKVYAMALYLPEKKKTANDVFAVDGPRRITLVMMRDVAGEDFGDAFLSGINKNTDAAEKSKIANQMARFGEVFTAHGGLKKGDVLVTDWLPGSGTMMTLNGKALSEPLADVAFYNALLKIWLGDKPADTDLKPALLGEKS